MLGYGGCVGQDQSRRVGAAFEKVIRVRDLRWLAVTITVTCNRLRSVLVL